MKRHIVKSYYFFMISVIAMSLCAINQGSSQTSETFTPYENKELGISFQYPSNWIEAPEDVKEMFSFPEGLLDKNLTAIERVMAETKPSAVFGFFDASKPMVITLFNLNFPNNITDQDFTNFSNRIANASGIIQNIIENTNITISNRQAVKSVYTMNGENLGAGAGTYTSITFVNGNNVIDITVGPYDDSRSSIVDKIIQSIKISNKVQSL
jgi:hypothetical protein